MHRFELEVPEDTLGSVLGELSRHQAVPLETTLRGRSAVLVGEVPADAVHGVQQRIPHLTRGEGVFTSGLDHYAPTTGTPAAAGTGPARPVRPDRRLGPDPAQLARRLTRAPLARGICLRQIRQSEYLEPGVAVGSQRPHR